jgi:hypothetical protein
VQTLTRVVLTEDAPAELLRMLPVLGVDPQAPDTSEHPDLLVSFSRDPTVESPPDVPTVRLARRCGEQDAKFRLRKPTRRGMLYSIAGARAAGGFTDCRS